MNLPRFLRWLARLCPVAIGRTQAQTLVEQKADAYQSSGERYTRTQESDAQKLDITPKPLKLVRRA